MGIPPRDFPLLLLWESFFRVVQRAKTCSEFELSIRAELPGVWIRPLASLGLLRPLAPLDPLDRSWPLVSIGPLGSSKPLDPLDHLCHSSRSARSTACAAWAARAFAPIVPIVPIGVGCAASAPTCLRTVSCSPSAPALNEGRSWRRSCQYGYVPSSARCAAPRRRVFG